jgi:uncharacterized membrane protein
MFDFFSRIQFSSDVFTSFDDTLIFVKHLMTLFGSLVILFGSLFVAFQFMYRLIHSRHLQSLNFDTARLGLTRSIILGLEFIIAADVIQTTTTPDYYSVGILAGVVLIRAFLNYSLTKDLTTIIKREDQAEKEH